MKLAEFLKLWTEDGTRLVKHREKKKDGAKWLLYAVYFPNRTYDHGRHMALVLKMDPQTEEILAYDTRNIQGELERNWMQGTDNWFEECLAAA